jgi:serine/threonine protein kinase
MQSGHLLRNRYRIENRLSAGGFGETYIAVDEDYPDKRRLVVKHLKPQSNDPVVLDTARRLFNAEAVTLAKLGEKTELIPTLYAYFEENKEFYLVQEFIEGQTLAQELGTRKLSEAETLKVVCEILTVLTEVHINRIIHRDLKPDNIIRRSRDRQLVLIDFGAVKTVRQTTLNVSNPRYFQSIGIGTDGYMPTEQAMGYPTSASDIYAVGAIALQCLTGKPPSELFDEDDLVFKWQHLCSVSDRAANILSKMVAASHLDRYANAMEAIKEIELLVPPVAPTPQPISQPSPVTYPKSYRLLARIIDIFIFYLPILAVLISSESKDGFVITSTWGTFQYLGFILSMLYFFFADSLPNGQSIGKRVFGIAVVSTKIDRNCTVLQSLIRNCVFLIIPPYFILLECLFILQGDDSRRIGDKWAKTIVIRKGARWGQNRKRKI